MIPLYGFLQGDTLGLLVLARADETMVELALKLEQAASVRVRPRGGLRVRFRGEILEPTTTVAAAGLTALDRFDAIPGDA